MLEVTCGAGPALQPTKDAGGALECWAVRIWAAIVVVGMGIGCKYGPYEFICTNDASCGADGACEANGFCSFPDGTCPSGRRFGDLGGPSAGQCLGCFGTPPLTLCFTVPPTGAQDVSVSTTFDTVTGTVSGTQLNCTTPSSGDENNSYCVIAADTINISAPLRAIGMKPLVLVAATSISVPVSGSIDVGSHREPTESIGAGADPVPGCNGGTAPGSANGTSGGGAGGGFVGAGGNGGNGGNGGGIAGTRGSPIAAVTALRGGCPGQDGAGSMKGLRGHGGGAVFLIAGKTITVAGKIKAGGEGGGGAMGQDSGGGGVAPGA